MGEAPRCIEILITLLDDECGPEAHKFAARALGNLAFEHGTCAVRVVRRWSASATLTVARAMHAHTRTAFNIHAIVAGGALPKLAKLLQSHTKAVHEGEALPDHAQVLRNTAGAIVNLASTSGARRWRCPAPSVAARLMRTRSDEQMTFATVWWPSTRSCRRLRA